MSIHVSIYGNGCRVTVAGENLSPLGSAVGTFLQKIFRRARVSGQQTPRPLQPKNGTAKLRPESSGQQFLQSIKDKLEVLGDDFAHGRINRAQYEELYSHYQRQKRMIENLQIAFGDSEDAKRAITEGRSLIIRRRNQARVIAFSIYSNDGRTVLYAYGKFPLDSVQVVSILSAFRDASREMPDSSAPILISGKGEVSSPLPDGRTTQLGSLQLGADLGKIELENGRVVCLVGGEKTILLILYSIDPSPRQLDVVRQVHQDFETTNRDLLSQPEFDPEDLFVPVGQIIGVGPTLSQLAAMTG